MNRTGEYLSIILWKQTRNGTFGTFWYLGLLQVPSSRLFAVELSREARLTTPKECTADPLTESADSYSVKVMEF